MAQPYGINNVNDGDSIFEDVYVYGKFEYDFSGDSPTFDNVHINNDLFVGGISTFVGVATFKDDVWIDEDLYVGGKLQIEYLDVTQRLNVGLGGTVFVAISTTNGRDGQGQTGGRVGVGTTQPSGRFQVGVGGDTLDPVAPLDPFESAFIVTNEGSIGIGLSDPLGNFMIQRSGIGTFLVTGIGSVGIGTTTPGKFVGINTAFTGPVSLDVTGPIRVDGHIYDSAESPGVNGYYMNMDVGGVRWIQASPVEQVGILVQDEGVYIPLVGTAQTFSVMNYVQVNSLGLGTDTTLPIPDPDNPTMIARIQTQDLWGFTGVGTDAKIYRDTKVGIKNNDPTYDLDITGDLHATKEVQFDHTLDVEGAVNFNLVSEATSSASGGTLTVDGGTGIALKLYVGGDTKVESATGASDSSSGALQVVGGVGIGEKLYVGGDAKVESTTSATNSSSGALQVVGGTGIGEKLYVGGDAKVESVTGATNSSSGALQVVGGVGIGEKLYVGDDTKIESTVDATGSDAVAALWVKGGTAIKEKLYVGGDAKVESTTGATNSSSGALQVVGGVGIGEKLYVANDTKVESITDSSDSTDGALVVVGGVGIGSTLNVAGQVIVENPTQSNDKNSGSLITEGGVGIEKNLNVGEDTRLEGTLELENSILDKLNNAGYDVNRLKNDYRLSAIGAGVSWRPSGVETENAIWVTVDGDDSNTGFLEGDAKRTVGAAAAVAKEGDTIIIRSGTYVENNPIGLRTDVSVNGEDLRLVTIIPQNRVKDVFHVRRGCLIQNINFSGPPSDGQGGVSIAHTDAGAVAFPPTASAVSAGTDFQAVTGYTEFGPADEGSTGRWKSPYIRNCTNFMTKSIGMKINGDFANADFTGTNDLGQDLKSMVCDAFTQYNEAGIGVSLSNNAYAQLVSIFTIASDIGISCVTGGQCDLTNSNSSFGNVGLKADGVGGTEFTGTVGSSVPAENDTFPIDNLKDSLGRNRKPFDGQGLFFKINLADYPDTTASGVLTEPLQLIRSIRVVDGGLPGDYIPGAPPIVTVPKPLGPEAIQAEFSVNVSAAGTISSVDVIASGRNFLPNQSFVVNISGTGNAILEADTDPILYTVEIATEPTNVGLTTVTFNEFVPYEVNAGVDIELVRISRIITSSHSFEYIGAGTDINKANPFQGGVPIPENEVIAINGGQCPFTSTDQKGNFRIGQGLVVDQTTSTVRGRDFNRAIQAQLTPLILALR